MATGAGKTYTAVTAAYRLLKFGGFRRILFLVDRNNLAEQTIAEFQNYRTPDDGRRFTELYNVDKLTSAGMLGSSHVVVSTIQRVYSVLRGKDVTEGDDPNLDDFVPDAPVTVTYSPQMPPEAFDLVIVDEAHRSIYGVWRGVLEYFDAHVVGLTATPGKQTFAFFRQNLVSEYTYPQSVADRVNVDFDLYRIRTEISEQGGAIEAGTIVPKVDRRTRQQRLEAIEEDFEYTHKQLDRAVTAKSQIRLVLETFRDRLFTEIFPGRSTVPKTLIFAKDDAHAEEIVTTVREVFGKGNDFAAKITYAARDPKGQLQAFRTSPTLRIAVTVDMIATGTDVKPLECVFFMRDVRSAQYFEQMKGRGARTIAPADFQSVTPDATAKTRFVIVDAVGVTEHDFVDPPLNRDKTVTLKKLLDKAANLTLTEDETATLASRLAKLELELTDPRSARSSTTSPVARCATSSGASSTPSTRTSRPRLLDGASDPDQARRDLLERAVEPIAGNPDLRTRILELRATHDRVIDEVSVDTLLDAHGVVDTSRAKSVVESWARVPARPPRRDHRHPARHRGQGTPHRLRRRPGARRPHLPPALQLDPRHHLERLRSRRRRPVRHSDRHTLTDLVSLLRYTVGLDTSWSRMPRESRSGMPRGWLSRHSREPSSRLSKGGGWTAWSTSSRPPPASPPTTSTAHPSPRRAASTEPSATSATAPRPTSIS
jgi:type I restriction enzyme R subunit